MNKNPEIPIVCELPVDEQESRREDYKERIFALAKEVQEQDKGFAVRFDWNRVCIAELGELLVLESDCCPFLTLELKVERGRGSVWMSMLGPEESKEPMREELAMLMPAMRNLSQ